MVTGHGEAFGGLQCRTELGPVSLLGAGGVLVEVAGRIGGRLLPLDADAAAALVNEVAGPDVFARLRGQRPWPVVPLVDLSSPSTRSARARFVARLRRRQPADRHRHGVVAVDALFVAG